MHFIDSILSFLDTGLLDLSWWQILLVALAFTHLTIASVTIYLHRHQAHRALELHAIPSHLFRFWLWMSTGMVTREWSAVHRKHHAKCEREGDPHSPHVFGIRKVLQEGAELYRKESKNAQTVERYGHGAPDDWLERHLYTGRSTLGISLMLVLNIALFGIAGMAVWALQMAWIPITAAGIINGLGHWWGYRNFDCQDSSTNVFPIGLLIGGEELHNNHHTYPTSAKLSAKPWEFDIGWAYIRALEILGLAKVRKTIPRVTIDNSVGPSTPEVSAETLSAVIAARYEVMARYANAARQAVAEELRRRGLKPSGQSDLALAWRWIARDESKVPESVRQKLDAIVQTSPNLKTWVTMRSELSALWTRSNLTLDDSLRELQAWCVRAEKSGLSHLVDFSQSLRSLRLVTQPAA